MEKTIDVIIPTYHPGREFEQLIERLYKQDCPINKIIIMNTEDALWNKEWDEKYPFLEVHHIPKAEFDHGGTRKKAAGLSGIQSGRNLRFWKCIIWSRKILTMAEPESGQQKCRMRILWYL